jgi:hypothetical protein
MMIYKRFRSTEALDDVPETYVWVKVDENRYRQYKGQRVIDIIHQYVAAENQEQLGSLRWGTRLLKQDDTLPAEGRLATFGPEWARRITGIEGLVYGEHWRRTMM